LKSIDRTRTDRSAGASSRTRALLEPLLEQYGITRTADVTHLDGIGLPVVQAIRPDATTLKVSSGLGPSADDAWVSAVMESLELWHAEHVPPPEFTRAITEIDLSYDPLDLAQEEASALHSRSTLGWIKGRILGSERETWVPRSGSRGLQEPLA
jgi:ribosomal protein S12 methylthiotransferase accessory factor